MKKIIAKIKELFTPKIIIGQSGEVSFREMIHRNDNFIFMYNNVEYEVVGGHGGIQIYIYDGKEGTLVLNAQNEQELYEQGVLAGVKISDIADEIVVL